MEHGTHLPLLQVSNIYPYCTSTRYIFLGLEVVVQGADEACGWRDLQSRVLGLLDGT